MKKTLSIILSLVFVLSLCSSAFAADNNLKMTYSTEIVNGNRINTFQYRDAEGRLIREEVDTLTSDGQRIEKNICIYNEAGQRISQIAGSLENDGSWRNEESVWTYNNDGSQVVNTRSVVTFPDRTQKFYVDQVVVNADGTASKGRGEGRDAFGNKLCDYELSYDSTGGEQTDSVKYTYPDGTASTTYHKVLDDGTVLNGTITENAAGQIVKDTVFQQNPNGSYDRTSITNTYLDNGNTFVRQTNESMDADGNRGAEHVTYTLDKNGFGSGTGVFDNPDGRRAIVTVEYRNDEDEGMVCATTYKYSDGTIDLRYEVTAPDGKKTSTYETDVKNYDGGDDEDFEDLLAEEAEDPFDTWDEAFSDEYEASYSGDPAALEGDGDINYYDTDVTWSDASDWGDTSNWSPDWNDYGDYGSLDDAAGWD